ncbi:Dor1-like family-domain-containing protein [Amanita rubescens]|nr:Dor1-like family-domain-containing protein [Amanita rubescens]
MENVTDILPPALTADHAAHIYLTHLSTLTLDSLLDEPAALQTQSHHFTSSLSSLIHTAYPTFLSLHDKTRALSSSLSSLSASLDSLIDNSLPSLDASASSWRDKTESLLEERRRSRVVLEQHDKVRDLLDIPVLMETCVRSGYFAEALSLKNHIETLTAAHIDRIQTKPSDILSSILAEVHYAVDQMHLSLIQTLHDPTKKLPALWKAVNFLRKMDAVRDVRCNEEEDYNEQLALAFLTGREACLQSILETLRRDVERVASLLEEHGYDKDFDDPQRRKDIATSGDREREDLARYLKKYIDSWREGVYDIVTQYSTIFLERLFQRDTHTHTANHNSKTALPSSTKRLISRLHALVTTHAIHALNTHLLPVLSQSFPHLSMSLLSSSLTQLTYCATAFSRVGLDFRSILAGITLDAVERVIRRELNDISRRWVRRLRKAGLSSSDKDRRERSSMISIKKVRVQELPSTWLVLSSAANNLPLPSTEVKASAVAPHVPPQILASYPPFAALINALMNVLNGLRLLAPIDLFGALKTVVEEEILATGGEAMLEYIKQVVGTCGDGEEGEIKVAKAAGRVYFEVLAPFVRRALIEGVYGVQDDVESEPSGKLREVYNHWENWKSE